MQKEIAVGVDGLKINKITFEKESVSINVESWLSGDYLSDPWLKPYHTSLFIEGSPKSIFLNDEEIPVTDGIIDLEILPGSYIRSIHTKQKI